MANADEIVSWLSEIHGDTGLVASEYRPVPLRYHFADNLGILPMFASESAGPGGRYADYSREVFMESSLGGGLQTCWILIVTLSSLLIGLHCTKGG